MGSKRARGNENVKGRNTGRSQDEWWDSEAWESESDDDEEVTAIQDPMQVDNEQDENPLNDERSVESVGQPLRRSLRFQKPAEIKPRRSERLQHLLVRAEPIAMIPGTGRRDRRVRNVTDMKEMPSQPVQIPVVSIPAFENRQLKATENQSTTLETAKPTQNEAICKLLAKADTYHDFGYAQEISRSGTTCQIRKDGNRSYNSQMMNQNRQMNNLQSVSQDLSNLINYPEGNYETKVVDAYRKEFPALFNSRAEFSTILKDDDDTDLSDLKEITDYITFGENCLACVFVDTVNNRRAKSLFKCVNQDKCNVINVSSIAQYWDQANSVNDNRVHVEIHAPSTRIDKDNDIYVKAFTVGETFDTNVRFVWGPSQNSTNEYVLSKLMFQTQLIAESNMLRRLRFSVINMCQFMAHAEQSKKTSTEPSAYMLNMVSQNIIEDTRDEMYKNIGTVVDKIYTDVKPASNTNTAVVRISNFLYDVKRSMDYGQAQITHGLNTVYRQGCRLIPTNLFIGTVEVGRTLKSQNQNEPRAMKDRFFKVTNDQKQSTVFYLMTFDRLCYMRCKMIGAPVIFLSHGKVFISRPTTNPSISDEERQRQAQAIEEERKQQAERELINTLKEKEAANAIKFTTVSNLFTANKNKTRNSSIQPGAIMTFDQNFINGIDCNMKVAQKYDQSIVNAHANMLSVVRELFKKLNHCLRSVETVTSKILNTDLSARLERVQNQMKYATSQSLTESIQIHAKVLVELTDMQNMLELQAHLLDSSQIIKIEDIGNVSANNFRKGLQDISIPSTELIVKSSKIGLSLATIHNYVRKLLFSCDGYAKIIAGDVDLRMITLGQLMDMYRTQIQYERDAERYQVLLKKVGTEIIKRLSEAVSSIGDMAVELNEWPKQPVVSGGAAKRPSEYDLMSVRAKQQRNQYPVNQIAAQRARVPGAIAQEVSAQVQQEAAPTQEATATAQVLQATAQEAVPSQEATPIPQGATAPSQEAIVQEQEDSIDRIKTNVMMFLDLTSERPVNGLSVETINELTLKDLSEISSADSLRQFVATNLQRVMNEFEEESLISESIDQTNGNKQLALYIRIYDTLRLVAGYVLDRLHMIKLQSPYDSIDAKQTIIDECIQTFVQNNYQKDLTAPAILTPPDWSTFIIYKTYCTERPDGTNLNILESKPGGGKVISTVVDAARITLRRYEENRYKLKDYYGKYYSTYKNTYYK